MYLAPLCGPIRRKLVVPTWLAGWYPGSVDGRITLPRAPAEHPIGIAEFMSPEQAEGKLVDQRSNTYSLGAILYFLLTGSPPVTGGTVAEGIEAIAKAEIAPPSIRRGGGLTAEVLVLESLAQLKAASADAFNARPHIGQSVHI